MPDPLPSEQAQDIGRLMRQLHDALRLQQGLEPVPSAWTFADAASFETLRDDIARLRDRAVLSGDAVLGSHRAGVGGAIKVVRTAVWKVLKPVFDRQSDVNLEQLRLVEAFILEHGRVLRLADALAVRVSELEHLAGVRRPGQ
jgi:hypothetical protein